MTSYAGADRSFFWNGPPPPSESGIYANTQGGAFANRAVLNIVTPRDTIDAQAQAGMPYGRNASEPGRPVLEFPFQSFRMSKETIDSNEVAYEELLDQLKQSLTEEVQQGLANNLQNRATERDPAYEALEKTLAYVATALLWLDQAAQPFPENSPALRFAEMNLYLTHKAMHHLMAQGQRIIREGLLYLDALGRGHIHYDALFQFLREVALSIKLLKTSAEKHSKQKQQEQQGDEQEERKDQALEDEDDLEKISAFTERLTKQYLHKKDQMDFQMIGALLRGIDTLNKTTLLNPGLRTMLYGLITINIGNTTESSLGFLGSDTKKIIDSISHIISQAFFYQINSAEQILIPSLISTLASACLVGTAALVQFEKEIPLSTEDNLFSEIKKEASEQTSVLINVCVLENLVRMGCSAHLLHRFIDLNKLHPQLKDREAPSVIPGSIELLLLLLIYKTLKFQHATAAQHFLFHLQDLFIHRFKSLENGLFKIKNEKIEGFNLNQKQCVEIVHRLTLCRKNLETQNFADFDAALDQVCHALGSEGTDFQEEFKTFFSVAHTYFTLFNVNIEAPSTPVNTIIQI